MHVFYALRNGNVDRVMIHDIFIPFVASKFEEMGFQKLWDPDKAVLIYDHLVLTVTISPGFTSFPILFLIIFSITVKPIVSLLNPFNLPKKERNEFVKKYGMKNIHRQVPD